jgi:hypothetical protein
MARVIALTALGALGLSGAPVHEPVHAWRRRQCPMTVTQRYTINIRRAVLKATRPDAGAMAHLHGMALSVVAAGTRRAVRRRIAAKAVRVSQQTPRHQQSAT